LPCLQPFVVDTFPAWRQPTDVPLRLAPTPLSFPGSIERPTSLKLHVWTNRTVSLLWVSLRLVQSSQTTVSKGYGPARIVDKVSPTLRTVTLEHSHLVAPTRQG